MGKNLQTSIDLSNIDRKKGIVFPKKMSENIAELVGIHFGDGCLSIAKNHTYKISYSFNSRDENYFRYVALLFQKIFKAVLKEGEMKTRHEIHLYIFSKQLCAFYHEVLDIPVSPKTDLRIPTYIHNNAAYIQMFIRGFFDTDGCAITQKVGKYAYHLIKITTTSTLLAQEIKKSLKKLGIRLYICRKISSKGKWGYDIMVRRKESVKLFYSLIQPINKKCGAAAI